MKLIPSAAATLAAALLLAPPAAAQSTAVVLMPADAPRLDVAGQIGWLGQQGAGSDYWFDAAAFSLSAGYYWTPHVKVEGELGASTRGTFYTDEFIPAPGYPYPIYRARQHDVSSRTASGTLAYQLLENRWVHPFVGGGVELAHRRERVHVPPFAYDPRGGIPPGSEATVSTTTYNTRPLIVGGFKFYVSPRAFVRTDVRWTFERPTGVTLAWRGGIGVDF